MMTINDINALSASQFVERFGFLFEHSAWVVEEASLHRPFASIEAMEDVLLKTFMTAGDEAVLSVLKAHPELGGRALLEKSLTMSSTAEQASAGLDLLSHEEVEMFSSLNMAYRAKFGFPFIICVRMTNKDGIVVAMRHRLQNSLAEEMETACAEVAKIIHLRLQDACRCAI